jgi:guanosine-3',5'-bis(diphosphate) 3'-pyrophosphohydrolase
MAMNPREDAQPLLLEAIAFAARAHRGQLRKDGQTPYASHAFRVCLIVRDLFGVSDRDVLMAAVLHDTVEDTKTDHDDIAEQFGPQVAGWVSTLSKDKRLPFDEREAAYAQGLTGAPWQVQVCKLADIFDNLTDSVHTTQEERARSLRNARRYLDALKANLKAEAICAWEQVDKLYTETAAQEVRS